MAIKIVEGLQHISSAKFAVVDIDDLYLDEENPRFASSALIADQDEITQSAIINYLVEFGEVLSLAESIDQNEGLFNETIISVYLKGEKVVVLEGNRRITACKILLNNDLVSKDLRDIYPIPSVREKTRASIKQINVVIYDDSADAQKYIASKHTQPDVKKWTTIEQYNYYYTQFLKGKKPRDIATEVGIKDIKKVEDKIRQYILFKKMFDLVKAESPHLRVETTSILPVVSEFMPKLLGNRGEYALGIEIDQSSLQYRVFPSQAELYDKILLMVGKAFFARPEAKKSSELDVRKTNDTYRISTDEIKGTEKVQKIIRDDIRIAGLKSLIHEFRNDEEAPPLQEFMNAESPTKIMELRQVPDSINTPQETGLGTSSAIPSENTPRTGNNQPSSPNPPVVDSTKEFSKKEKQISFFADLRIEHLDPAKPENRGLIAVAKEIREISSAQNYLAYSKYPIASTFLLRSLIEQVLARQLKKGIRYSKLAKGTGKPTIELGKMIEYMLKQCENGNLADFNSDSVLSKDFNSCFAGFGTKDQLDKVIHRPAECQPDKIFLDNLAKQGLKDLLQRLIDSFI